MSSFDPEKCDRCGECLARCPVIGIEPGSAAGAIEDLICGSFRADVLDRCTGCMSCDYYCPRGAHPYGLLMEWFAGRYERGGIPRLYRAAMPQSGGPDLWAAVEKWLSPRQRSNILSWSSPPASDEILFLGCNQRLTPAVADSSLFSGIEVFTDPDQCCGEFYLRLGMLEEARRKAASLSRRFRELGVRKVVAFCPACHNTMANLAPGILGVDFDVEPLSLVDWLAERVGRGDLVLRPVFSRTATVQDPCHASMLDSSIPNSVRELLRMCGFSLVEMENHGREAECCGLGASLARYRIDDVLRTGVRRTVQARRTGAKTTVAWCNGCYMVMNLFHLAVPLSLPVMHLVEALQYASGETPRGGMLWPVGLLTAAVEAAARNTVCRRGP